MSKSTSASFITRTKTERGIAKVPNGWIHAEVDHGLGAKGEKVTRRKLLDGPFKGSGAKRAAIQAAGTNRVVSA